MIIIFLVFDIFLLISKSHQEWCIHSAGFRQEVGSRTGLTSDHSYLKVQCLDPGLGEGKRDGVEALLPEHAGDVVFPGDEEGPDLEAGLRKLQEEEVVHGGGGEADEEVAEGGCVPGQEAEEGLLEQEGEGDGPVVLLDAELHPHEGDTSLPELGANTHSLPAASRASNEGSRKFHNTITEKTLTQEPSPG